MTEDQSVALGGLYLLIFFGVPIALFLWACHRFGPRMAARKRDRQIETSMRLGLRDAEAYERIAQQIRDERHI
ncbi:hypothetical protein [Streptomyces dysideae]|nr:hypothetical protein [Streptomyces dysideae]